MAVVNERAVISVLDMLERSVIRLPKVLGGLNFDQQIQGLFSNGKQGFFYDPNDLSTMYQDAAGTVPVTATGQPVGLIKDKSGRGNHASQTTSTSRPILRKNAITGAYYLEFDGSDDFLVTNSIDFTVTDKISLFAGVQKLSDVTQIIAELSIDSNSYNGTFYLVAGSDLDVIGYTSRSRGSSAWGASKPASSFTYVAPDSAVLSAKHDISGSLSSIRRNGVVGINDTDDQGTGNYGNYPLCIGRRGGAILPFYGHIYSLIGVGRLTTANEIAAIEKELAKRTGVTLSV